jgi:hypothetical protein
MYIKIYMKKNILIEIETDDTGQKCGIECIGLCGYYCDIYGERVENRERVKRCKDAEMHKGAADKNDD